MLSILIPAYRFSVQKFVQQLYEQATQLEIPFEIRIYDDASGYDYLNDLGDLLLHPEIRLQALPENLGRSRIRNKLSREARYDWLLFADADSLIPHPDYLQNYWSKRKLNQVLVGGTAYLPVPPEDPATYFRWYYGMHREQRSAEVRAVHPFTGFSTHHFFCHRTVFDQVQFPEQISGYGHEDTLFGLRLQTGGFTLQHLDNPLLHIGLEPTSVYLEKSREALRSLLSLQKEHSEIQTKLTYTYDHLSKWYLAGLFSWFYRIGKSLLEQNFHSRRPSLRLFDLYRLGYYARQKRSQK
jgi:glycosyltransferase involved in cell wall biosynthesis